MFSHPFWQGMLALYPTFPSNAVCGRIIFTIESQYFKLVAWQSPALHFNSRLKTYLFNKSYPPVVSLLPPGLPSRTFARIISSELIGFVFSFSLIFVSVSCTRLSWPYRQLLSAHKYILSYVVLDCKLVPRRNTCQSLPTVCYITSMR